MFDYALRNGTQSFFAETQGASPLLMFVRTAIRGFVEKVLLLLGYLVAAELNQQYYEINTVLMETTFRIEGIDRDGNVTIGTGFIIGDPER